LPGEPLRVIVRATRSITSVGDVGGFAVRLLIVSYAFPPTGGVSVQRVAKLAKFLPRLGVKTRVLTTENPSVPVTDEALSADIPSDVEVFRTPTFEPDYRAKQAVWRGVASQGKMAGVKRTLANMARSLFLPDAQILWLPTAAPMFRRLAASADMVLVSGPPFSPFLLGPLSTTPFVLDYRDEWRTTATFEMHGGAMLEKAIDALEPFLLRRAARILTATDEFRENLRRRYPEIDPGKIITLSNGYDPDDVEEAEGIQPAPYSHGQKLVVTYAGTVFRLSSPRGLFEGLLLLSERSPHLAKELDVRFFGRIVETEKPTFERAPPCVRAFGFRPRKEALAALAESHLALCILDDVPGAAAMKNAKIFEIMQLGRPCLALAPQGALSRLIEEHGLGLVLPPRDAKAIAHTFERLILAFQTNQNLLPFSPRGLERYHRRVIAQKLVEIMRGVMAENEKRRQTGLAGT